MKIHPYTDAATNMLVNPRSLVSQTKHIWRTVKQCAYQLKNRQWRLALMFAMLYIWAKLWELGLRPTRGRIRGRECTPQQTKDINRLRLECQWAKENDPVGFASGEYPCRDKLSGALHGWRIGDDGKIIDRY